MMKVTYKHTIWGATCLESFTRVMDATDPAISCSRNLIIEYILAMWCSPGGTDERQGKVYDILEDHVG